MDERHTFGKNERLHSRKLIGKLFSDGSSFFIYPFKVIFLEVDAADDSPAKLLITVSKRNFKKAVQRNRIKRLIRESYRLNKQVLYSKRRNNGKQLLTGLIFVGKTIPPFAEIERKIILILHRLTEQDEQTAG